MTSTNGLAPDAIKIIKDTVSRVESLESEKRGLAEDIKDIFVYAKEKGVDVKALKALIKRRKKSRQEHQREEDAIELYEAAMETFEPIT